MTVVPVPQVHIGGDPVPAKATPILSIKNIEVIYAHVMLVLKGV
ncbi:MAG: ABC transporter ATP-binding protein, partial [Hyphomicrobiaceae bacterium]|nr:ABC transporter ATP-binding protein [Hyphomicrobiaceae bacterium]